MTARERFDAYFQRGDRSVDRLPIIEYAPYWDETLAAWESEGLQAAELDRLQAAMGLDTLWYTTLVPAGPGCPAPPAHGAPIIEDEAGYEAVLPHLYPADPLVHVRDYVESRKMESDNGTYMFLLNLYGFFWWPRTLLGIENHLVSFYEQPELYHRICRDLLAYNIRAVDAFLETASPPFVLLGEDMSYNHGPMIGKPLWDIFLKPYYLPFIQAMRERGLRVIYDSDGMVEPVIPWVRESGFDGILPLERMAGVDVNRIAEQHPGFKMIGGFDKTVMKHGEEAMRAEFERILPAMRWGDYIPCVDHQTPPDVCVENYHTYIRLLREYAEKALQ